LLWRFVIRGSRLLGAEAVMKFVCRGQVIGEGRGEAGVTAQNDSRANLSAALRMTIVFLWRVCVAPSLHFFRRSGLRHRLDCPFFLSNTSSQSRERISVIIGRTVPPPKLRSYWTAEGGCPYGSGDDAGIRGRGRPRHTIYTHDHPKYFTNCAGWLSKPGNT
jgi:hypothetical protein